MQIECLIRPRACLFIDIPLITNYPKFFSRLYCTELVICQICALEDVLISVGRALLQRRSSLLRENACFKHFLSRT